MEAVIFISLLILADNVSQKWAFEHLKEEAQKLATQMKSTDYLAFWGQYPYRISLIDEGGKVIYDNRLEPASLSNHADREEVKAAIAGNPSYVVRDSTSAHQRLLYYAVYLPSYHLVLRVCMSQRAIYAAGFWILGYVAAVMLLALLLSALVARYLTRSIIAPLNSLESLESKSFKPPYSELFVFFDKIIAQKKKIKKASKIIARQERQFQAISQNISEGIVLLDEHKKILSFNDKALMMLPHLRAGAVVGENSAREAGEIASEFGAPKMQNLDSSKNNARDKNSADTITDTIADTEGIFASIDFSSAKAQAQDIQIQGCDIEMIALPVLGKSKAKAFVVLLLDRSEKIQNQRLRREFSANVTHELKTPLSTIMASSEMMKQGMIAQGDIAAFSGKIYEKCKRLLDIINDILKLSFFDEGGVLEKSRVCLKESAQKALNALSPLITQKRIQVRLNAQDDENLAIFGVPNLIEDMLYNLCENAIKYNHEGGKLEVSIYKMRESGARNFGVRESDMRVFGARESGVQEIDKILPAPFVKIAGKNASQIAPKSTSKSTGLQAFGAHNKNSTKICIHIKDDGIGIPLDEQEKVFERFYRVDKSRSKKLGGTGLGLSIIKHIALYHGAQILLKSEEGKGCEVVIIFDAED